MVELERYSHGDFRGHLRMKPAMFHELVIQMITRMEKQKANYRSPLRPGLRLAVILPYLAIGDAYHSLKYSFRVSHNTMSGIVKEMCVALVDEYAPGHVIEP